MQWGVFSEEWRTATIRGLQVTDGLTDVYEFGVFSGNSMVELDRLHHSQGVPVRKLIGFDSFEGIPKETAEPIAQDVWDPELSSFYKAFNSTLFTGTANPEHAMEAIYEFVATHMVSDAELLLVPGFYSDSLTPTLVSDLDLGKAAFVDIDCDIYTSSIEALSWLFENDLVATGTYVAYDDWGGTPGYREGLDGESRAHREISEEYGVEWELVATHADNVPDSQIVFRVR